MILRNTWAATVALLLVDAAVLASSAGARLSTSKRGLIGVDNTHSYADQSTLIQATTLSWAYNYGIGPGNDSWFGNLEYVPQCWGGNDAPNFIANLKSQAPDATHILTFNEPDGQGGGQATMTPAHAADLWRQYIEPLHASGIKLGSPATTGSNGGIVWLQQFMGNCTDCHVDFLATHYYGDFQGLASHLGHLYYAFNATLKIWVTELADAHAPLAATVSNYNAMIGWLDGLDWVERYAWFGAFRSIDSNVGTNATFLNATGNLTQLGRSYLYQAPASSAVSTPAASGTAATAGIAANTASAPTSARSIAADTMPRMPTAMAVAMGMLAMLLSACIVL